jgi:hypothetical protein
MPSRLGRLNAWALAGWTIPKATLMTTKDNLARLTLAIDPVLASHRACAGGSFVIREDEAKNRSYG